MVDFAKMSERIKKRDEIFIKWIKVTWPNGDWNKLSRNERDLIVLAFNRGYGQGFAQGTDGDIHG